MRPCSSRCGRASGWAIARVVAEERRLEQAGLDELAEQLEEDLVLLQRGVDLDAVASRRDPSSVSLGVSRVTVSPTASLTAS